MSFHTDASRRISAKQKDGSHPCTSTTWQYSNTYKGRLGSGKGVIEADHHDAAIVSLESAVDRGQDTPSLSTRDDRWVINSNLPML